MKFKIYWLTGEEETLEGETIATAFSKAGYGGGAIRAVDYYEPIPDLEEVE